jgi:uncharacterized protein (TIGR02301 family)
MWAAQIVENHVEFRERCAVNHAAFLERARRLAAAFVICASLAPVFVAAAAATEAGDAPEPAEKAPRRAEAPAPEAPANPAPSDAAPAYEPQLLRLSELLGALAYLQDLCGHHQGAAWRAKMTALLDAEAKTPVRKERLAGAFNRGFQGYALTYRLCTPNAEAIIGRFLSESSDIARDVARRYGPS